MLAGFLLGIVHDRRMLREAQVNLAIRWFIGYGLHEELPDHSSLTRIRQRWGAERFRRIFERTVQACVAARIAKVEIVHVDASLIRADVSWESLAGGTSGCGRSDDRATKAAAGCGRREEGESDVDTINRGAHLAAEGHAAEQPLPAAGPSRRHRGRRRRGGAASGSAPTAG